MTLRILVTGEGPWTTVSGGCPGDFKGEHISEVRPLCIAEALQKAGHTVSFLSEKGIADNPGGFSFRCVGKEADPSDYDVIVCHQSMFWYYQGFDRLREHPNILISGDLFPRKETPQNIRWIFYDAPGHVEAPALRKKWPKAVIQEGCFGVTEYKTFSDPFPNHDRPNIVYLGKIYDLSNIELMNGLADSGNFNIWFGGKIAGRHVGKTYDAPLTDTERKTLFSDRVEFLVHRPNYHGPVSTMEAARYCQHADLGLVFDPGIRTATVSKMYFYMSCGTPSLIIGGCSNAAHAPLIQAGSTVIPGMWRKDSKDRIIRVVSEALKKQLGPGSDREGIKQRALKQFGYAETIKPWLKCWEQGF